MTSQHAGPERHRGREAALQLLYQWEIGRSGTSGLDAANDLFWELNPAPMARRDFAGALVKGTTEHLAAIDPLLESNADNWRLSRMAVIDRLIMRMAVYEFVYTDTPRAVVIDEALELAKTFSADEAVAFINGILDGVCRQLEREGPLVTGDDGASQPEPKTSTDD